MRILTELQWFSLSRIICICFLLPLGSQFVSHDDREQGILVAHPANLVTVNNVSQSRDEESRDAMGDAA
jgi:hypothetical protein